MCVGGNACVKVCMYVCMYVSRANVCVKVCKYVCWEVILYQALHVSWRV